MHGHGASRVGIAHGELPLLQDEGVVGRGIFEKGHGSLDAPDPADDRTNHDDDDPEMGEQEAGVVSLPRIAHESAADEVCGEKKQPKMEPRRFVEPNARGVGVEFRFEDGARDAHEDEHRKQNDGEAQRCEELKDRVSLPGMPRRARGASARWHHEDLYAKSAAFGVKEGRKQPRTEACDLKADPG